MPVEFRYANTSDVDAIFQIESGAMSQPWSVTSYIEAIESDHAFIILAIVDDIIVGHAVFYLTTPEAELPDIVIAEEYRGKDIGKGLLGHSILELKKRGVDTVYLEVRVSNFAAINLYKHFGFFEIGRRKYFYSNPIEDAICMAYEIK